MVKVTTLCHINNNQNLLRVKTGRIPSRKTVFNARNNIKGFMLIFDRFV